MAYMGENLEDLLIFYIDVETRVAKFLPMTDWQLYCGATSSTRDRRAARAKRTAGAQPILPTKYDFKIESRQLIKKRQMEINLMEAEAPEELESDIQEIKALMFAGLQQRFLNIMVHDAPMTGLVCTPNSPTDSL